MNYLNSINDGSVDSQTVGIIIVIPVTGTEEQPLIARYERCEGCERPARNFEKFCSHCGGKIVEVTDKIKFGNKYETENVPLPDVRKEMEELGIESHLPFGEDRDEDSWKFVFKCYETIGHRSHFCPFLHELDIKQIQADLEEAKEKFKEILKKYNGKVVFGIAGEFADW
jgi:hypothetical protein